MKRMKTVFDHLAVAPPGSNRKITFSDVRAGQKDLPWFPESPDDIVVACALRTPIGKAKRGSFKDTYPEDLLSAVLSAVLKDTRVPPDQIGDICVGNVLDPRAGLTVRAAQFFSGIPDTVPINTCNRQCSSGLQAFMNVAGSIRNGSCNIGIAAGYETLSRHAMGSNRSGDDLNPKIFEVDQARDCLIPMGITSENVASRFGISREKQDMMGLESQQRAAHAHTSGLYAAEMIPVTTIFKDQSGNERTITVTKDDGIRPTTMEGLRKLKPAFQEGGTTTAGTSSQVSDGAAAVLVAKRSESRSRELPVLGVLRSFAVCGCPPDIMGIGPSLAIPKALERAGLTVDDIEIYEINEAFASQAMYCVEKLGIPLEKVNPKGGAIALGHPLGCTGARQIATLLHELKRRGNRSFGVVSMCIGTGMGAAAVFEYPG